MHSVLKRSICLVLTVLLCLSFASCGKEEKEETKKPAQSQNIPETPAGDETPDTPDTPDTPNTPDTPDTPDAPDTPDTPDTPDAPDTPDTPDAPDTPDNPPAVNPGSVPADAEQFFNEAAFIGDSVTLKLRNYNTANGSLYKTTFLCQGSYSVAHAVNNTMMLTYQGNEISPQDALKACGAKRVFILLGMNDIALHGIDKTIENWGMLVSNIRSTCPDIEIYIQSGTPIYLAGEVGSLTNANMDKYNVKLQAFAAENGCTYVDVNTPFKNASGGLAPAYCSDEYVHFTDAACKVWINILMKEIPQ